MAVHVVVAGPEHKVYAAEISELIESAAKARGTGIAKRPPAYVATKIDNGNAVVALDGDKLAGFCYVELWGDKGFIANSGLVVHPDYRNQGLARKIKQAAFKLSRTKFPDAKLFGITTSLAVMKINVELGYVPVTFSELTSDPTFWDGCQSCPNHDILTRNERKNCLCTGMLMDPKAKQQKKAKGKQSIPMKALRLMKELKQSLFLKLNPYRS